MALSLFVLLACDPSQWDKPRTRRVVLIYAMAYNDLSPAISEDIKELCEGDIPGARSTDVLLVYARHTAKYGDYKTPSAPVLYKAYRDNKGNVRRDTLTVYPDTDVSASPEVLNKVLTDVQTKFPARSYGVVFTSHATGWIPSCYQYNKSDEDEIIWASAPRMQYPLTKSLGEEFPANSGTGIEIRDLADVIPMKLDFCLMDACLMGGVEVAYELKDKCDYLVCSPTEILSNGFIYTTMAGHLFAAGDADLRAVCEDVYNYYEAQSGIYRSCTITLVDCSKLEPLAGVCADIIATHRQQLESTDRKTIQAYFYNRLHWYYDLRSVMRKIGADEAQMARLESALADCILYFGATEKFFDLKLEDVCGLSMYFPYPDNQELNDFYKPYAWNIATGLIQ